MLLFLVPFTAALIVAIVGCFSMRLVRGVVGAALAGTFGVAVYAAARVFEVGPLRAWLGGWRPPLGIEWRLDPLAAFVAVVVAGVALATLGGSLGEVRRSMPHRQTYFHALSLLLLAALMGMIATHDLFNLFVHLEVASLSSYALVAAGGRGAPRAALKYLIIGSLAATFYLLGVGFLYAATGSLNMSDVAGRLAGAEPRLVFVGSLLIFIGLGVKMALFPLHGWMPDAYARAPAASASLMAPLVTKVAAYALIRVLFWVYQPDYLRLNPLLPEVLCWAGAAAMIGGGVLAILQEDFRRLLAYSSVSQMGLVAIGAGLVNTAGMTGAVLHIANDALMKGTLFLMAAAALSRFGVRRVDDLSRLRGRAPWIAAAIAVAGVSLVGLPPLCGFFGKWYVLRGAMASERWGLAGAVVVGSLLTAVYVFRLFERLYFAPMPEAEAAERPGGGRGLVAAGVVLAAAIVGLGLANERIVVWIIHPALPTGL